MTASFLLALCPPAAVAARVVAFREAHQVRDAAATPHITVKARSGLAEDLAWHPVVRAVTEAASPVNVTLLGPRRFPGDRALYLAVQSPQAVALHLALLEALKPARRFGYEGPDMTPHLSLVLGRRGLDLQVLLEEAQTAFGELDRHPLNWTAQTLTLMRKAGPGAAYQPVEAWPLGADRGPG
ncbi:2'-5' RNA ligase family protein [Deinococcus navajonensis]|uniref:2'-5' RNA ligase family protein n=1 Tax=Deinococcus navajonensis TaxID=309884 RepID=A0ABV8XLA0_9DEIO